MAKQTLYSLSKGRAATVRKFLHDDDIMPIRLRDLGLIEGGSVLALSGGGRGGIASYLIKGAVIALREEDCLNIVVSA